MMTRNEKEQEIIGAIRRAEQRARAIGADYAEYIQELREIEAASPIPELRAMVRRWIEVEERRMEVERLHRRHLHLSFAPVSMSYEDLPYAVKWLRLDEGVTARRENDDHRPV